jgi:hypothetical protein
MSSQVSGEREVELKYLSLGEKKGPPESPGPGGSRGLENAPPKWGARSSLLQAKGRPGVHEKKEKKKEKEPRARSRCRAVFPL